MCLHLYRYMFHTIILGECTLAYVYVHMYVCTYVYVHICIHVFMYICIHVFMYVCMYLYMHT